MEGPTRGKTGHVINIRPNGYVSIREIADGFMSEPLPMVRTEGGRVSNPTSLFLSAFNLMFSVVLSIREATQYLSGGHSHLRPYMHRRLRAGQTWSDGE